MKNFKNLVHEVLLTGELRKDRTGTGVYSLFAKEMVWDLSKGFPAVTSKKLAWESVKAELFWFLEGSTNVYRLSEILHGDASKSNIWTANYETQAKGLGYKLGELGPVYGAQFHRGDQLNKFIEGIKNDPFGRRHIISLWNPEEIEDMALPPCHGLVIQGYVSQGRLSLLWYQRSVDIFLGLPFNIASYALFCHIVAKLCGLEVGNLHFRGGDCHIYTDHVDACSKMLSNPEHTPPTLVMPEFSSIEEVLALGIKDFKLQNYEHSGIVEAVMSV